MFKNKWIFLLINIVITLFLFLILAPDHNLLHFINTLFYIFLVYLLFVLIMYTAKGGFFDGVTYGFRRFNSVMFKRDDYLEEWRDKPLPSETVNMNFYQRLKFQFISILLLLLVLLILYYIL
jgi:hypothetical protein